MGINEGRRKITMPQALLEIEEINACLKRMGGIRMAQCSRAHRLKEPRLAGINPDEALNARHAEGSPLRLKKEKPLLTITPGPLHHLPELEKELTAEVNPADPAPLAQDADLHGRGIDIADLEARQLGEPDTQLIKSMNDRIVKQVMPRGQQKSLGLLAGKKGRGVVLDTFRKRNRLCRALSDTPPLLQELEEKPVRGELTVETHVLEPALPKQHTKSSPQALTRDAGSRPGQVTGKGAKIAGVLCDG